MAIFEQGTRFASFTIGRLLGAGRGDVYEAFTDEGARRALKVLDKEALVDPKLYARFVQEADVVATLEHVHVVRFFGAGVTDGRAWMLLELVDGKDLGAVAREAGGALPAERAVRLVRQACAGVAAAHDKGILHRDLAPWNIMVTADDTAKVCDFGSAKIEKYGVKTTSHSAVDSALHMAPEFMGTGVAEPASDVYSMGIVLYEVLAGANPFAPGPTTTIDVCQRQLFYVPPPLETRGRGVSSHLSDLVRRMLSKAPAERPTMREVIDALGVELDRLHAPRRAIARRLPTPGNDERLAPTEPAMAAFTPAASAAPPPPTPVSTLRSAWAPPAKTMPMEAVEAPAERRSTSAPVERPAAAPASGKRGSTGIIVGVATALSAGAIAVGWMIVERGGDAGDGARGAEPAVAASASAPPAASSAAPAAARSAEVPAPSATTAPRTKPAAPPGRRAPARPKLPF